MENSIDIIMATEKPIKYTYGLKYRGPRVYEVPVTKEEAIQIIKDGNYAHYDLRDRGDYLDLNLYSSNDMY